VVTGVVVVVQELILDGVEVVTVITIENGFIYTKILDSNHTIKMYKRIEPENLVVGKTYYIVPTARLITHNKKDVQFIREHLKTRFLFPEGKLETMKGVAEGSSYAEAYHNKPGYEFMPTSYYRWLPACAFTGLKSHGKPLLKSAKNFIYGPAKVQGYTFFSTELTPDPAPAPAPAPHSGLACPHCKKDIEIAVENGLFKLKIKSE